MANDAYKMQGLSGGMVLDPSQTFTGRARGVSFPEATVILTYAGNLVGGATKLIATSVPAGYFLPGITTGLSLTSGQAILYATSAGSAIA